MADTAGMAGPAAGMAGRELSSRRKALILAICCMSLLIVGLDSTIVNVALPSIQRDLHASVSGLQWTVDAYTLVLASLLMLSGSTADRVGRRRTFQTGLAVFTLGSLLCSLAPGPGLAGRVPDAAGRRRLDAQPGRHVDHHEHLHRARRAGPRDRRLGRRGRHQHGARPAGRRRAGGDGRLARDLLGQHPGRPGRARADRAVRARVEGAARPPGRPGRPVARHRDAGVADLRDHRGPGRGLDLAPDRRLLRRLAGRGDRPAGL